MSKDIKAGLELIANGLVASFRDDSINEYEKFKDQPDYIEAKIYISECSLDEFNLLFLQEKMKPIEGLIEHLSPGDEKLKFFLMNLGFIESHIGKIIKDKEGWACSADKLGHIRGKIFWFLFEGEHIEFDSDGAYYVPKTVLNTHDKVIDFFEALYSLHHGKPSKYLAQLASIYGLDAPEKEKSAQ